MKRIEPWGGTSPTDNHAGDDTSLTPSAGDITLQANFTTQEISAHIDVTVNNNQWVGNGSGSLSGGPTFNGVLDDVTVSVPAVGPEFTATGEGAFTGFFTNFSSGNPPGAAGMSWFMRAPVSGTGGATTTINGASALELGGPTP